MGRIAKKEPKKTGPRAEVHPRDPEATKARLIEAVARVLARDGFAAVGLRSVAAEAGTDKKLIYRYFGGLPDLLEAYASGAQFWPTNEELAGCSLMELRRMPLRSRWARVLKNYIAELRRRPLTLEILRWELSSRNGITARLEAVREARGVALTAALAHDLPPDFDAPALTALISSAIVSFLRSRMRKASIAATARSASVRSSATSSSSGAACTRICTHVTGRTSPRR